MADSKIFESISNFRHFVNVVFSFWVIPRACVNCLYRRFETLCLFHCCETWTKKIQEAGESPKKKIVQDIWCLITNEFIFFYLFT